MSSEQENINNEIHSVYCLLPTAYCLLPTAYCILFIGTGPGSRWSALSLPRQIRWKDPLR
ncbi:MAG: hypothetical protein C4576_01685 [Desulfobacteraceae bacterium]|nr:MAG: hypothetical protein C4576_01685 [Desulfobacteraceae bacterium]